MTLDTNKGESSGHDTDDKDVERIDLAFESVRSLHEELGPFLSTEGIFIAATEPLAPSTVLRFRVIVGGDFDLIEGTGVVVWTRSRRLGADLPPGMAVRYVTLGPQSEAMIAEMVAKHIAGGGEPFDIEPETDPGIRRAPLAGLGRASCDQVDSSAAAAAGDKARETGSREPERVRLKVRSAPPVPTPKQGAGHPAGDGSPSTAAEPEPVAAPPGVAHGSVAAAPLDAPPPEKNPPEGKAVVPGERPIEGPPPANSSSTEEPVSEMPPAQVSPDETVSLRGEPSGDLAPISPSGFVEGKGGDELTQASPEFTLSFTELEEDGAIDDTPQMLPDADPTDAASDLGIDPPPPPPEKKRAPVLLGGLIVIAVVAAAAWFVPWQRWLTVVTPETEEAVVVSSPVPIAPVIPTPVPKPETEAAEDVGLPEGNATQASGTFVTPTREEPSFSGQDTSAVEALDSTEYGSPARRILQIVVEPETELTIVRLIADGELAPVPFSATRLGSPERLLIQLPGLEYGLPEYALQVDSPHLTSIRSWVHDEMYPPELHVVIDLSGQEVQVVGHETDREELRFILQ